MRIGGTESVIKSLVEGLDTRQFEAEILCIEPRIGPFGTQMVEQGIKVSHLDWTGGFNMNLIAQIRDYLTKNDIHILHCHQYTPWFYGTIAAAFLSTKVVFTEHGRFYPDRSSWKRKFINPLLLRFTRRVTAISKATKEALAEFEFIPRKHVEVIYNGISGLKTTENQEALKTSLNIETNELVFGTVARLVPIKNQKMMLKAFADVCKNTPNVKLLVVGDGELRGDLEKQAEQLGIKDKVIFTGYKSEPQLYINLIDVFLLSSFSEGTSMTLLEAMSLSKPCVVTDAGGNREVIQDGVNGFVTPNDDHQKFANAMSRLSNDVSLLKQMGTQGRLRFDKTFSQVTMLQQYQKLYEESLR